MTSQHAPCVCPAVRTLCDRVFEKLDLRQQIWQYSTPKVRRLLEVLQAFAPPSSPQAAERDGPTERAQPPDRGQGDERTSAGEVTGRAGSAPPQSAVDGDDAEMAELTGPGGVPSEPPPPPGDSGEGQAAEQPRFSYNPDDPAAVCGLVFVKQRITAKVLYRLIKELREVAPELAFVYPQYIVGGSRNVFMEPAEVGQAERKKQEDVLCR